jgi:hypothetical protein
MRGNNATIAVKFPSSDRTDIAIAAVLEKFRDLVQIVYAYKF